MSDGPREVAFCPDYTVTLQIVQDQLSALSRFAGTRSIWGTVEAVFLACWPLFEDGRAARFFCGVRPPFYAAEKPEKSKILRFARGRVAEKPQKIRRFAPTGPVRRGERACLGG
jgi:hypothetical protein